MNSNNTAPAMHHVAKVKSRLKLCVPQKEGVNSGFCQADLISLIGRINLSPFPVGKKEAKPLGNSDLHISFANAQKGSQKAPIPVGDTTPKAILDKKIVFSPEVTITGSSISKDRPNHTAAISFGEKIPNVILDRKVENSPEVTIIGTLSFKDRQNQLARDADVVYNQTGHPNVKNDSFAKQKDLASVPTTADVIELADDEQLMDLDGHTIERKSDAGNGLIILQPKNNLVFPLAHNSRFPVSDEDIMHYCAIVDLAYKERIQKNYAIVYHGVHCNFVSLGQSLMRDGHVDNFLVPCFCRKLFEDNHPSKSGRHYSFPYVGGSILELSNSLIENIVRTSFLGAASASKGKRLDLADKLFFPICHLEHWFTFAVDFKWKLFCFLDSVLQPQV